MPIDEDLLSILACPLTKQPVREDGDWLVCDASGLKYPVCEGIPVMLIEEAVKLDGSKPSGEELERIAEECTK